MLYESINFTVSYMLYIIPIPKFTNNHQDVKDRKDPFDVQKTVHVLQLIGLEIPENIPLPHHHQLYQQVTLLHHQMQVMHGHHQQMLHFHQLHQLVMHLPQYLPHDQLLHLVLHPYHNASLKQTL